MKIEKRKSNVAKIPKLMKSKWKAGVMKAKMAMKANGEKRSNDKEMTIYRENGGEK